MAVPRITDEGEEWLDYCLTDKDAFVVLGESWLYMNSHMMLRPASTNESITLDPVE